MTRFALWRAPVGWLGVVASPEEVAEIVFCATEGEVRRRIAVAFPDACAGEGGLPGRAVEQLAEYFDGRRRIFDLPLAWSRLSPFARDVLRALCRVPWGETVGYGELAALSGHPRAARAVGRVMAANPFPVVVPCHRVTAAGRLGGYSGGTGVASKEWLLRLEGAG